MQEGDKIFDFELKIFLKMKIHKEFLTFINKEPIILYIFIAFEVLTEELNLFN